MTGIEIFLSCSHTDKDAPLREELENHLSSLKREREITIWHTRMVSGGTEYNKEIQQHLDSAHVILMLISPDFFTSEECWKRDKTWAMKRKADGEALVIPVLLRSCNWKIKELKDLQPLPVNGEAITSNYWSNEDEAFKQVAEEIRKAIEEKSNYISIPQTSKRRFKIPWRDVINVLPKSSMPITLVIIILRLLGAFEASEFWMYDQMMMSKRNEDPDARLLIIQITEEDRKNDKKQNPKELWQPGASLSDTTMFVILHKLIEDQNKKPKAIGLDIYRDFTTKNKDLREILINENNSIFGICNIGDNSTKNEGVTPPPEFKHERLGFSDLWPDGKKNDSIVRRQMLYNNTQNDSPCVVTPKNKKQSKQPIKDSFPWMLAKHYLKDKKYEEPSDGKFYYKIDNTIIDLLSPGDRGGYSRFTHLDQGHQILLNYRNPCLGNNCSPQNVAETISVKTVLQEDFLQKYDLSKRIVLIGVTNASLPDSWSTPFSEQIYGVTLQAQMLSQILSAVEDKRQLLKVLSIIQDLGCIFLWSLLGGILAQSYQNRKSLIIYGAIASSSLLIFCYFVFIYLMIWIPFVPNFVGLLSTIAVVLSIKLKS